jgi:hypothetical protein
MVNGRLHGEQVVAKRRRSMAISPPTQCGFSRIIQVLAKLKNFKFAENSNRLCLDYARKCSDRANLVLRGACYRASGERQKQ